MSMPITINQMRSFYTAAKFRNIRRAAKELNVTPSAVSMQIKQIEDALELKLLFRDGNIMKMTEVGQIVYQKCNSIFDNIKELEELILDISTKHFGVLKIGCPQVPSKYIMPRLITMFRKKHTNIKILLDEGHDNELINNILSQKNELVLIRNKSDATRLEMKILGTENIILLAAPSSRYIQSEKISLAQVSTVPMILPQEGSSTRDVILEYFKKFKLKPLVVFESGSVDFIKGLVKRDTGIAFLGSTAVKEELKNKTLKHVHVLEGSPTMPYGIAYLKRSNLSPAALAFLRFLDSLGPSLSVDFNVESTT